MGGFIVAAFSGLLGFASAALAQVSSRDAVSYQRLGQCLYQHDPALAEKFLQNSDPGSVDEGVMGNWLLMSEKLGAPDCLRKTGIDRAMLNVRHFRELLAEEAYLARFKSFPDSTVIARLRSPLRNWSPKNRALVGLADCIATDGGKQADAILRTQRGSSSETAQAKLLKEVVISCLGSKDAKPPASFVLRGLIADGLWSRYLTPLPQQTLRSGAE